MPPPPPPPWASLMQPWCGPPGDGSEYLIRAGCATPFTAAPNAATGRRSSSRSSRQQLLPRARRRRRHLRRCRRRRRRRRRYRQWGEHAPYPRMRRCCLAASGCWSSSPSSSSSSSIADHGHLSHLDRPSWRPFRRCRGRLAAAAAAASLPAIHRVVVHPDASRRLAATRILK